MTADSLIIDWVSHQRERMRGLVEQWAGINSGSHHLEGLARFAAELTRHFSSLGTVDEVELPAMQAIDSRGQAVSFPLGKALSIRKRPEAPLRVFLGIHMDTVYGRDDPFQQVERIDGNTLRGPGVADAKGGLAVMLVALEALERSDAAGRIGWEVLINPDEEIGSPGSAPLLAECARRNHLGMVFEPALADGAMVAQRKGSGNFSVVVRGRAAHAGRDFASGRNAVVAAAQFAVEANRLNGKWPDMTINVGRIEGGGPSNVVPDLAIVRLNVRVARPEDQRQVVAELDRLASETFEPLGVTGQMSGQFLSPPWAPDDASRALCEHVNECGRELDLRIEWRSSGGASDANKLAAAGLPVVDTLGPRGGNLHSPAEFVLLDSLIEKAKLAALLLIRLASGQIVWPPK